MDPLRPEDATEVSQLGRTIIDESKIDWDSCKTLPKGLGATDEQITDLVRLLDLPTSSEQKLSQEYAELIASDLKKGSTTYTVVKSSEKTHLVGFTPVHAPALDEKLTDLTLGENGKGSYPYTACFPEYYFLVHELKRNEETIAAHAYIVDSTLDLTSNKQGILETTMGRLYLNRKHLNDDIKTCIEELARRWVATLERSSAEKGRRSKGEKTVDSQQASDAGDKNTGSDDGTATVTGD